MRNGRVTWPDFPPVEGLEADATFDGTTVAVDSLRATWQGGGIEGRARVPRALLEPGVGRPAAASPGRVDLTLTRPDAAGAASVAAGRRRQHSSTPACRPPSASTWPRRPRRHTGTLVLDEAAITAAGVPITQARPARMSIAGGVLSLRRRRVQRRRAGGDRRHA